MIEIEKVAIASLLHDIGKLRWRVLRERKNHQDLGADWLEERGLGGIISGAARYHHGRRFSEIKNSNYLLVVYEADNLSAGERRIKDLTAEEGEEVGEFEAGLLLLSIFSRISLNTSDSEVVKPSFVNLAYCRTKPDRKGTETCKGRFETCPYLCVAQLNPIGM